MQPVAAKNYNYQDYLAEVEVHGDKTALIDGASGERLSYRRLVDLSWRVADQLRRQGLKPGDRLVIIGVRGLDWVPIFFGCQLAAVIAVPIDTRASDDLVAAVIKKTAPVLVVKGSGLKLPAVKSLPPGRLLQSAARVDEVKRSAAPPASSLGQVLLSSGTWSQPKGVTLKQSNLLQNMLAAWEVYRLSPDEVLLSLLPLSHAYEQMCGLHLPLRAGCTVVYLGEIQADKIKAAIKRYRVTMIVAVPRILELFQKGILKQVPPQKRERVVGMAHKLRFAPVAIRRRIFRKVHQGLGPSLRTLVVGGAALPLEVDHFFQGLGYRLLVGYGLSETSPIISILVRQKGRQLGGVGRILPNIEAKVNDDGELLVRGPTVFAGYWPQKRSGRAWFNTGDVVDLSDDGSLRMLGRSKDLIVFASGDKAMAGEAEDLILKHLPAVEEAIVMSTDNETGTSEGLHIAYRATKDISQRQFEQLFRAHLPRGAQILTVRNIEPEFLNRTHTLKLARKSNYDRFVAGQIKRG